MQFYQLYTIHIQIGGFYPPCLYDLLPNKTEQLYSKFLNAITSVSDNAQPSRILLDFERAAVNAFTSEFPESSIKGCYSHLCQAFLRKINELGLKKAYENNCELSLALRLIPALSFVPTDLVEQSFESAIEEIEHVVDRLDLEQSLSDKIDELASYFQRSYIKGETIGRNSRQPLFPMSLWNHSQEAAEGLIRTTNAFEGWHLGVTALFQGSHPSLYTFLNKIQMDSANQKFNILKAMGEHRIKGRRNIGTFMKKSKTFLVISTRTMLLTIYMH